MKKGNPNHYVKLDQEKQKNYTNFLFKFKIILFKVRTLMRIDGYNI